MGKVPHWEDGAEKDKMLEMSIVPLCQRLSRATLSKMPDCNWPRKCWPLPGNQGRETAGPKFVALKIFFCLQSDIHILIFMGEQKSYTHTLFLCVNSFLSPRFMERGDGYVFMTWGFDNHSGPQIAPAVYINQTAPGIILPHENTSMIESGRLGYHLFSTRCLTCDLHKSLWFFWWYQVLNLGLVCSLGKCFTT